MIRKAATFLLLTILASLSHAQDSKEPLKLSSPDIRKAFSKLPPAAKKTVDRLNELIKKKEYTSNEDILQKAIATHRSLFDDTLLGDFMLGYVLEHNIYPMGILKKNGFTPKQQRTLSANYFLLSDGSTRANYMKLLAKINESGKADPSKLSDEERSIATAIERELVAAGVEKPFFSVDIGKVDAEATQKMEKAFADDVAAIVKSEPGSNVLDLTQARVKREFDLKEKEVQVELLALNRMIMGKKYDVKDEYIFQFENRYGLLLNRKLLNEWLIGYSNSKPAMKEMFAEISKTTGLSDEKMKKVITSYVPMSNVDRLYYIEIVRSAYKNGVADFSLLGKGQKSFVEANPRAFP